MVFDIKIPTLLGLSVLLVGLGAGVFLVTQKNLFTLTSKAAPENYPQKITVANLSGSSASLFWQTNDPSTGFIQAGTSKTLGLTFRDDRDPAAPQPHKLHFVTLTNLSPETTYYYKIVSGPNTYPKGDPSSFKTTSRVQLSAFQPVIGTVIDSNLQPIEEAFAVLQTDNNQLLATITKIAGSFVLPLTLLPADFRQTSATITLYDQKMSSRVTVKLPAEKTLLPIVLGQDLDLTSPPSSASATPIKQYDVNGDKVINSLDLSEVYKNFGKNPKNKKADLNGDGVVDQKDVNLLLPFVPQITPKR